MADVERILLTGASGFLGKHIRACARARGQRLVAACRSPLDGSAIHLDVCNPATVEAALSEVKPSVIIHCAAYGVNYAEQDWRRAFAVNVEGTLCVLEAAARHGARKFMYVGSCFEYGSRSGPISEEAPLKPTASYGATKAAATILASERARSLKLPLTVVRPFGMWGPDEPEFRIIPQVIRACKSRSPLKLTSCEVLRDYMYVGDVAEDILQLSEISDLEGGTIVNIASGEGGLLRDFVLSVARLLGGEGLMKFGELPYRPTEMPSLIADVRKLHRLIGAKSRMPIAEGVKRMIVGCAADEVEQIDDLSSASEARP